MPRVEPSDILSHLGGTSSRKDLLRYSTRAAIERAVRRREIERTARGRFALPELPEPLKVAALLRGEVSHASAAAYWNMEAIREPTTIHITVPRGAHRRPTKSVVLHYSELQGERVTPPLRTVLDCARAMSFREALAITDSALRRDLVTPHQLTAAADACIGPGSRKVGEVFDQADPRADNPFESALRAVVIKSGVGGFIPQFHVPGTNYRVDLADPERMIVLEADSFAFHGGPAALERDMHRYDELIGLGWLVLRFAWRQVILEEVWVTGVLVETCLLRDDRRGGPTSAWPVPTSDFEGLPGR